MAADLLDEARQMPGDLRIGRPIVGIGGRDRLRLAEAIDLDHPGHDRAARRLPDESRAPSPPTGSANRRPSAASSWPGRAPSRCARPRPARPSDRASRVRACGRSGRGSFEEHQCVLLRDEIDGGAAAAVSPERTAWAAAETPWLMVWQRLMRRAQAGGACGRRQPMMQRRGAAGLPSPAALRHSACETALDCRRHARSGLSTACGALASRSSRLPMHRRRDRLSWRRRRARLPPRAAPPTMPPPRQSACRHASAG